jgi:hypothetical protein
MTCLGEECNILIVLIGEEEHALSMMGKKCAIIIIA